MKIMIILGIIDFTNNSTTSSCATSIASKILFTSPDRSCPIRTYLFLVIILFVLPSFSSLTSRPSHQYLDLDVIDPWSLPRLPTLLSVRHHWERASGGSWIGMDWTTTTRPSPTTSTSTMWCIEFGIRRGPMLDS